MEEEDYTLSYSTLTSLCCTCSCCNGSKAAAIAALSSSLLSSHSHNSLLSFCSLTYASIYRHSWRLFFNKGGCQLQLFFNNGGCQPLTSCMNAHVWCNTKWLLHINGNQPNILVTGTGPLGCVPAELAMSGSTNGECAPEPQRAAQIFNPELFQMLQNLNRELGSDIFITANAFAMNSNLINNPQRFGFVTSKVACCGQGRYNGLGLCTVVSNLCPNRNIYVFWDAFHPTERANRVLVQQLMTGTTEYMNPMNLSTIMALDAKS